MKFNHGAKFALAVVATSALAFSLLTPAQAAKHSTVIVHYTNELTGFNSNVTGFNLVTNGDAGYP